MNHTDLLMLPRVQRMIEGKPDLRAFAIQLDEANERVLEEGQALAKTGPDAFELLRRKHLAPVELKALGVNGGQELVNHNRIIVYETFTQSTPDTRVDLRGDLSEAQETARMLIDAGFLADVFHALPLDAHEHVLQELLQRGDLPLFLACLKSLEKLPVEKSVLHRPLKLQTLENHIAEHPKGGHSLGGLDQEAIYLITRRMPVEEQAAAAVLLSSLTAPPAAPEMQHSEAARDL